jgi:hypothetical protein
MSVLICAVPTRLRAIKNPFGSARKKNAGAAGHTLVTLRRGKPGAVEGAAADSDSNLPLEEGMPSGSTREGVRCAKRIPHGEALTEGAAAIPIRYSLFAIRCPFAC